MFLQAMTPFWHMRAAMRQYTAMMSAQSASLARIVAVIAPRSKSKKAGVVPLIRCRGFCIPLWTVFPPLQVVLSSACSVASLSRFPSHYLPGHPHLREDALADYLFGQGSPSTWFTGLTPVHDTPSAKLPFGAQRGVTLPRYNYWNTKELTTC